MFKPRTLTKILKKAVQTFPAVVVTGPRQSGKTTLLKHMFGRSHSYVSFETPPRRLHAQADPEGFLNSLRLPVILDEIQYVPELLSYIKTRIDTNRNKTGQWLLTGSQNFILMQGVTESLAGRIAVLSLLPFSFAEKRGLGEATKNARDLLKKLPGIGQTRAGGEDTLASIILRGGYPELVSKPKISPAFWSANYITTYLERDVRNLKHIGDLRQFEIFVKLCATRTGQILNLSELARDVGISGPTAKKWLSVLETGYQIFLLSPYYRNVGKRIIKSPKIYFNDTAIACYLLGLEDERALLSSPHFPHLFETFVIGDFWKRFLHHANLLNMYYLKTRDGLEVDLVIDQAGRLDLFEIKSSATIFPRHADSLVRAMGGLGSNVRRAGIISQSRDQIPVQKEVFNYYWRDLLLN